MLLNKTVLCSNVWFAGPGLFSFSTEDNYAIQTFAFKDLVIFRVLKFLHEGLLFETGRGGIDDSKPVQDSKAVLGHSFPITIQMELRMGDINES